MDLLFMALAVFWVIRLIKVWVDAPSWAWMLAQVIFALIVMLPWTDCPWYTPASIAAIVAFLQMAENFLIAKADEAVTSIIRRR